MASTTLITDTGTMMATGPTAATRTAADRGGCDWESINSALTAALVQAKASANTMIAVTDAADPMLPKLQGIVASLV